MIEIICYTGGTCGDLVTALIDSQGTYFRGKAVMLDQERLRFKKPHTFANDVEKDQYLNEMSAKYRSIPSHDLQYHINRKHSFIGITVTTWSSALKAAQRFKDLHRPHVWAEMTAACGADSIESYAQIMIDFSKVVVQHTDKIITLESIQQGTALDNPILQLASKNFYKNWSDLQNNSFIT